MASAADPRRPAPERRVFWAAAVATVVLDLITKLIAEATLLRTPGISVLGDWFQLRLVYNQGAAFGLHVGPYSRWIFFTVALVAVFVLARMSRTQSRWATASGSSPSGWWPAARRATSSTGSAAPAGVVDFLDVGIGALRWPTFNVADIAVSCGAIALAISLWREDARRPEPESASADVKPRRPPFEPAQNRVHRLGLEPSVSTASSPTSSASPEPRRPASSPPSAVSVEGKPPAPRGCSPAASASTVRLPEHEPPRSSSARRHSRSPSSSKTSTSP